MKKICLTATVGLFLSLCTNTLQAQTALTKLNQVELMKQFIGMWKAEPDKETNVIVNNKPYGKAIEGNFKIVTKDKILDLGKQLWGYDEKNDKFIVTFVNKSSPQIDINAYWFTSRNICEAVPFQDISNPKNSTYKWKQEFKSHDLYIETLTKNDTVIQVLTFKREPKVINQLRIGKITWSGNLAYNADTLNEVLGLRTGDNYDPLEIKKCLNEDVSLLYLDDGYAWYRADFVENQNINNIVDLTISVFEGSIAKIGEISVTVNLKVPSSDILKNIELKSGDLWSKTKIMNSILTIASMGKIDAEKIADYPTQNMEKSTKDYAIMDVVFGPFKTNKK
jgi:hypothetical protein